MSEVDQQTEKGNVETASKSVRRDEEIRIDKEPELEEAEQGIEDEAQEERMRQDDLIATEGGKEDINLKDEEKALQERSIESKDFEEQGKTMEKLEKSSEKCEQVEVGKKDISEKKEKTEEKEKENEEKKEEEKEKKKKKKNGKEEEKTEERKEKGEKKGKEDEKKEKKEKKSKSSSERVQKKLEKLNAKISRILAKKEEYESRLKEAQDTERQESEKAGQIEALTGTGKSAQDDKSPGSRTEGNLGTDQFKFVHDTGALETKNKSADR